MRLGYYWPTMPREARDMIRACNDCQIHRPVPRNPQQPLTPITAPWPFYKWGIDIAGPFPEGPGKVKFLIVVMDYSTKWIEAKAVATIIGNKVKKFVWDNIVCRFGLLGEIILDNDKQFSDNPFKDWCDKLNITKRFALVKHPYPIDEVEKRQTEVRNTIRPGVMGRTDSPKGFLGHVPPIHMYIRADKELGQGHDEWWSDLIQYQLSKCKMAMKSLYSEMEDHIPGPRERDQYQQVGPSVDEIPKYKEDPVMPESSSGNKRKEPPVKKKSSQVNEASGSKSNLTPEEHAEIMDKEAFADLEEYASEFKDWDFREEQENRIGIMLSVDDEHIIRNTEPVNPAEQTHVIASASSAPVDEQPETSQDPSTEKAGSSAPVDHFPEPQDPKKKANKRKKKADSEQPLPFRIYHKNRGRSERIAKFQAKKFKFDANGTRSTPEKAFDVND
ncbi:reverse transcriptase domain-containing protein [Tanacetum coccineum]